MRIWKALLLLSSIALLGAAPEPQVDQLSLEKMQALVAGPIEIVQQQGFDAGASALEALVSAEHDPLAKADLLESFGVQVYMLGSSSRNLPLERRSLAYVERAVPAYRAAVGDDDPEVAIALTSYADLVRVFQPDDPPRSVDDAYAEAHRILEKRFGPSSRWTLGSLVLMAEMKAMPSRSYGDPAAIEEARKLLQTPYDGTLDSADPGAARFRRDIDRSLDRLSAVAGARIDITRQPSREKTPPLPPGQSGCGLPSRSATVLFSGDDETMIRLLDYAQQKGISLHSCPTGLELEKGLNPGTDVERLIGDAKDGLFGKVIVTDVHVPE